MDKTILEKLKAIKATTTPYRSNEKWLGKDGKIYYIDRTPINWDVIKGERNNVRENSLEEIAR